MTDREAFEAWADRWGPTSTGSAWAAWQAATAAERERAAQIAERHYIPGHSVAGPGFAADCAAAIRERGTK
jgi:hypothetical protein